MSNIHSTYLGRFLTAAIDIFYHIRLTFCHQMRRYIANLMTPSPASPLSVYMLVGKHRIIIERLIGRRCHLHLMIQVRLELELGECGLYRWATRS